MYQLGGKILPIVLPPMVEAENFSDHPRIDSAAEVIPPLLHPKWHEEHEISNTEYPLIPSLYKRPKSKMAAVYQMITGNAEQRRAWSFVF
jgi:hypothetical protein